MEHQLINLLFIRTWKAISKPNLIPPRLRTQAVRNSNPGKSPSNSFVSYRFPTPTRITRPKGVRHPKFIEEIPLQPSSHWSLEIPSPAVRLPSSRKFKSEKETHFAAEKRSPPSDYFSQNKKTYTHIPIG